MFRVDLPTWLLAVCCSAIPVRAQHGEPVRITDDPWLNGYAEWAPGDSFLVYTTEQNGRESLWKISLSGGAPVRFCEYRAHHVRFSPDGRHVVFDGDDGTRVMIMNASGGVPIRVVPESVTIERSANPVWSPDGRRIAFRSESTLCVLDLVSGDIRRVYDAGSRIPIPSYWTLDGTAILAGLLQPEPRSADLWRVPIDGSAPQRLTFFEDVLKGSVSPDERWLVFDSRHEGNSDLWVMPFAGGDAVRLTTEESHELEPRWAHDGRRIVFTSTRDGAPDLWVMVADVAWIANTFGR